MSESTRRFLTDGVEIQRAVLDTEEIASIRAEVSIDHEILHRAGIRNLEKKFACIAQISQKPAVLSRVSSRR
jgi:hypothetical protein